MCLFSSAKWSCSLCKDLRHAMGQFLEQSGNAFGAGMTCWEGFILVYPSSHASNGICSSELGLMEVLLCQDQWSVQVLCLYYLDRSRWIHCGFRTRTLGRLQLLKGPPHTHCMLEHSQCQPAYSPWAYRILEQHWASSNEKMQGDVTRKKA